MRGKLLKEKVGGALVLLALVSCGGQVGPLGPAHEGPGASGDASATPPLPLAERPSAPGVEVPTPANRPSPVALPDLPSSPEVPNVPQAPPPPLSSPRRGPLISPAGSLGQFNLSSRSYIMAFRFMLDEATSIDRWYFAINGEGASCIGGRTGYGAGNGGTHYGRIVEVDASTGLPTDSVLASETVSACEAHARSRTEFGLSNTHQAHFVELQPVRLEGGKLYAFLLSNLDENPGTGGGASVGNHMSPNLNFAVLSQMGPHGVNTLDPDAPGAVYGLDPRETTLWSPDGGQTWRFGDRVGWYQVGSGRGRMWLGGYRIAGGRNVPHGWPYMNWPGEGEGTLTLVATKDVVLTRAGGASASAVGVVTVKNLETGVEARTSGLEAGLVEGALSAPVSVSAGQRYSVSCSGAVDTGASSFWDRIYGLGKQAPFEYSSACERCSNPAYRPMLYAAP